MGHSFPTGQRARSTPSWSRWHHRLHRSLLASPHLLPSGAALLVAVSGGQDSLCLLRLLKDLQRLHHWSLQVFHGDHRWRPDSALNAEHVQSLCATWGLTCHLKVATHLPSEAAARQWRYASASALCRHLGCHHLVTGHTATDRAETLLFHLCRGSGSRGLSSLRPQRQLAPGLQLIRPLLHFSRQDTLQCCQALQLPIWPDASNEDLRLTRNRIRNRVLPELEQVNGAAVAHMAACAQHLAEESDLLDRLAQEALAAMGGHQSTSLSPQALAALPQTLASRCLAHWIRNHTGRYPDRQQRHQILHSLSHPRIMAALGRGWRLHWRDGRIHLERGEPWGAVPHPPMDPQTQPPNDDAHLTAGDGFPAGDGGLLELPLQEHHHRIISAFMAENQQDSSQNRFWKSSFGKGSRLPGFRVLRKLAGWLGKR